MHQPHYPAWPPSAPPAMNGHDLQLGQTLGMIQRSIEFQTDTLREVSATLRELPHAIAAALPPAPQPIPRRELLTFAQKLQLAGALLAVAGTLTGKAAWQHHGESLMRAPAGAAISAL